MFDLIYNFILENLLTTTITTESVLLANSQLALILTHASIVLIFVVFVLFIKFMFTMTARLFGYR